MSNYKNYENLENWVSWVYFKEKLNWPTRKISYELDKNEQRFLEWVNERAMIMTRLADSQPEEVKKIQEKLKKKYPTSQPAEREMPNLDIKKVVKAYREGMTIAELAGAFKTKYEDFLFWWNRNLKQINAELTKP